ncbi:replication-relaxation family protein [Actinacidiphila glaucinigra]|uniref:replication-relaxation family protein n=1 Tax=Actinacidiphila glaucinigra TaxID=235986 RepID=UPI00366B2042
MTGTKPWRFGSTARTRSLVLLALGVVKVATAAQLRQLVLPGTVDVQTVRNACKDLRDAGLVESVGKVTGASASGRSVGEQLWNLTAAGLAAAGTELDRPPSEMGGTAREAARAGAAHAVKVTDTIDAFFQAPLLPTRPVARRGARPTRKSMNPLPARPPGLGTLHSWHTEVALPVTGTFTTPGRGSLRADAVLTAPEEDLPVLFVEVDNGTEPPARVADKIARYRRFFQRTVKDQCGQQVLLWSTLWQAPGRGGFPPVAFVFTKQVGPKALQARIQEVARLSGEHWQGMWCHGRYIENTGESDGYRDYEGVVPVVATTLDRLREHGPHGAIWWRFGHSSSQVLTDALDNPDDRRAYNRREEQRLAAQRAAWAEDARREEDEYQRWQASLWPCPTCGDDVDPDDGPGLTRGDECPSCTAQRERSGAEQAEAEAERERERRTGLLGWLRG